MNRTTKLRTVWLLNRITTKPISLLTLLRYSVQLAISIKQTNGICVLIFTESVFFAVVANKKMGVNKKNKRNKILFLLAISTLPF